MTKKVVKYSAVVYVIYTLIKSESLEQVLERISISRLIRFLKGASFIQSSSDDLDLKNIFKELKKDIKNYPSHLAKSGANGVKNSVKLKLDDFEPIPGVEVRVPNPLNLVRRAVGSIFVDDDQKDQHAQNRLISDLLKEAKKKSDNIQDIPETLDYLQDILNEYNDD